MALLRAGGSRDRSTVRKANSLSLRRFATATLLICRVELLATAGVLVAANDPAFSRSNRVEHLRRQFSHFTASNSLESPLNWPVDPIPALSLRPMR